MPIKCASKTTSFKSVNLAFSSDMGAIRNFIKQMDYVGRLQDQIKIEEMVEDLNTIVVIDKNETRKHLEEYLEHEYMLEIETEEELNERKEVSNLFKPGSDLFQEIKEWSEIHLEQASQLADLFFDSFRNPAVQGKIIRWSALIFLVSRLDSCLSALHQILRLSHKNKNNTSAVKRDRLTPFEEFGIDLAELAPYRKRLAEITTRRNLFIHHNGLVNMDYISRFSSFHAGINLEKDRQFLRVSTNYLDEAVDTVELIGIMLIQKCWRALNKDEKKRSDEAFVQSIYTALVDERYQLCLWLIDFAHESKSLYRIPEVLINKAVALKALNKLPEFYKVLKKT